MDHATDLQRASAATCTECFCLPPHSAIAAKIVDVVDGDTLRCAIYSPLTGRVVTVDARLSGIDAAETRLSSSAVAVLQKRVGEMTRAFVAWQLGLIEVEPACFAVDSTSPSRSEIATAAASAGDLVFLSPTLSSGSRATTFDAFGRVVCEISPISRRFRSATTAYQGLADILLSNGVVNPFGERWTAEALHRAAASMRRLVSKVDRSDDIVKV